MNKVADLEEIKQAHSILLNLLHKELENRSFEEELTKSKSELDYYNEAVDASNELLIDPTFIKKVKIQVEAELGVILDDPLWFYIASLTRVALGTLHL